MGLWVVFVVVSVVLSQVVRPEPGDAEGTSEPSGPSLWSYVAYLLGPAIIGLIVYAWHRAVRGWRINQHGRAFLAFGDFENATRIFDGVARKARGATRADAVLHLGLIALRQGQLERALSLFTQVEASQLLGQHPVLGGMVPSLLSLCEALLGDLVAARKWLEAAHQRGGEGGAGYSLVAEVLLLCREGHFAAAAKAVDARWREAERSSVWETKVLRVLKAFALDGVDPTVHAVAIYEALAGLRPVQVGQLDLLAGNWPKLADFMAERGLLSSAVT